MIHLSPASISPHSFTKY